MLIIQGSYWLTYVPTITKVNNLKKIQAIIYLSALITAKENKGGFNYVVNYVYSHTPN